MAHSFRRRWSSSLRALSLVGAGLAADVAHGARDVTGIEVVEGLEECVVDERCPESGSIGFQLLAAHDANVDGAAVLGKEARRREFHSNNDAGDAAIQVLVPCGGEGRRLKKPVGPSTVRPAALPLCRAA